MASPHPHPNDRTGEWVGQVNDALDETLMIMLTAVKGPYGTPNPSSATIKSYLATALPEPFTRFDEALNALEIELLDAKAVLLRDLNTVRGLPQMGVPQNAPTPLTPANMSTPLQTFSTPASVHISTPAPRNATPAPATPAGTGADQPVVIDSSPVQPNYTAVDEAGDLMIMGSTEN